MLMVVHLKSTVVSYHSVPISLLKTILIWLIDSSIGSSFEVIIVCATICQVGSIEKQREETTNHINYIVEKKIRVKN